MKKKSNKKDFLKFTFIASVLTVIAAAALIGGAILLSVHLSKDESDTPEATTTQAEETTSETLETTVAPFDIVYDGFLNTGNQTMYAYCDADGDGKCDNGANIFVRPEPTVKVSWTAEIFRGTEVTRTAVYYVNGKDGEGWSKIIYDGQTYYVQNRYLSETDPGPGEEITIGQ